MAVFRIVCQRGVTVELVFDGDCRSLDLLRDLTSVVVAMLLSQLRVYLEQAKRYIRTKGVIIRWQQNDSRPSIR